MQKTRECTIRCSDADPIWDFLKAKQEEEGLPSLEEALLRAARKSFGLPEDYPVIDMRDMDSDSSFKRKPVLRVVK